MVTKIRIAIADDHVLFRKGLANLLSDDIFIVKVQADNGKDLIEQLKKNHDVQVILMDLNMPTMNGFEATKWLKQHKPDIKVLAITMSDADKDVIRIIKSGAHGYLLKDSEPLQVKNAIQEVIEKGFYFSEMISGKLINSINENDQEQRLNQLLESLAQHELDYIQFACSDLNHKEIGVKMGVSHRTIDGYRDHVFAKIGIQSRVGLVLFAIKNDIFKI